MRLWRLLIVVAIAGTMFLTFAGRAWASCSTSCPRGFTCVQVCSPDLW